MASEDFTLQIANFMGQITQLLSRLSTNIDRLPENHQILKNDFTEIKNQLLSLLDSLKSQKDLNHNQTVIDKLNEIKNMVAKNDGSISLQNKQMLEEMVDFILSDKYKKLFDDLQKLLDNAEEVTTHIKITLSNEKDKITPCDFIEVIKFARMGNKVISYIKEKYKAILFIITIITLVTTIKKWWPLVQTIIGIL